jgi:RimJ/RimL family protein N-acetyltransferase
MKRIRLRALTKIDLEKTLKWHNQDDIRDLYSGHPFPVNREMEEKWYEKTLTSNIPFTAFGIELCENAELIGITVLKEIDLLNRSAEFANYIGDAKHRGKGLAREAVQETLMFGFNKLGLNRIFLRVFYDNDSAIKLYKESGFIIEGTLRKCLFRNNQFKDVIIFSILREEYFG